MADDLPCLHICVTCAADEHDRPGQALFDRVSALLDGDAPVTVQPVKCMAACDRMCTASISQAGKWRYLLGGLSPALAEDLLVYGAAYARSASGAVMPSKRPDSLRKAILGRVPA